jgi:diadenosine tetraphosphate (Ap4A) HIT family hydrolase
MDIGCLFCDKSSQEKHKIILENELFYARLDDFPVTPGHTMIVPKRHVVSLMDLTEQEWAALKPFIKETIAVIESTDMQSLYRQLRTEMSNEKARMYFLEMLGHTGVDKKPDAYNFGVNEGEAAGRTMPHLHWHIIPRYFGDVKNPRGGVRNIIPGKGDY